MAATSTTPRPTAENPIPTCRTPSAIATRSCPGVPATARIRPASLKAEDDPTLRKGDIVAGSDGLVVANRNASDRHGIAMNFSPLPEKIRAKFRQVPVVAKE
jgi:hypothetical protein